MSLESNREVLSGLEPVAVWDRFAELTQIPRPSKLEAQAREHILDWAKQRGLDSQVDSVGNILVRVPGRREGKPLLLQGHIDMVCVPGKGEPNSPADFSVELELGEDGWLRSKDGKTSVGADNGVGVSTMMALVDDPEVNYPPLELLFTIDEEDGLDGVGGLDLSMITADRMVNMDSEDGPDLTGIASAAGRGFKAQIAPEYSPIERGNDGRLVIVRATGFQGGHSGLAINKGIGNPLKALVDSLSEGEVDLRQLDLMKLEGGTGKYGNVIPSSAELHMAVNNGTREELYRRIEQGSGLVNGRINQPGQISVETAGGIDPSMRAMSTRVKHATLDAIGMLHDGVLTRRKIPAGAPDVSSNLGWVRTGDTLDAVACIRGHNVPNLEAQFAASKGEFTSRGFTTEDLFNYGGWEIDPDSTLLAHGEALMRGHGIEPKRWAYHCGLEVGELVMKMEAAGRSMDAIATGPMIQDVHGINERIEVASVEKWYAYLKDFLATV